MSTSGSTEPASLADHALHLLQGIHPTCSHDLPNQAVALESLLHLLSIDEGERLSPQGQEYLQRLQSVAGKISSMTQFLREMVRLQRQPAQVGEIVLGRFQSELKGELHRHLPDHSLTWGPVPSDTRVLADRRLLLLGVTALIQAVAAALPTSALHLGLATQQRPEGTELRLTVAPHGVATPGVSTTTNVERRLEFTLAGASLALTDIACRIDQAADRLAFVLTIPHRSIHG
jgi:light-regulated signal transduction histidine kinase (bacteriophytochrome)